MRFKARFALWALGQALPDGGALRPYLHAALLAVMAAAAAGTVAAFGCGALLMAFHAYLIAEGLSESAALLLAGLAGLGLAGLFFLMAWRAVGQCSHAARGMGLFASLQEERPADTAGQMLSAFLDGLAEPPPASRFAFPDAEFRPRARSNGRAHHAPL